MHKAQGLGRRAQGKNRFHLYLFLTLSLEPYALSHEISDDALMAIRAIK
jgi:hypothetical protein